MTAPLLPQLEELLRETAERNSAGARARSGLRVRGHTRRLLLAAGSLAIITGTALAAIQPWNPTLGGPGRGHPSVALRPPPASELKMLGVLRRPQTAADRGPAVRAELSLVGSQVRGVRTAYIRQLGQTLGRRAVVLVPVSRFGEIQPGFPSPLVSNALCVVFPFPAGPGHPSGAAFPCWTAAEVRSGRALSAARGPSELLIFGLVPDGVRSVRLSLRDTAAVTVAVHSNFFVRAVRRAGAGRARAGALPTKVAWLGASGHVVGPPLHRFPAG